MNDTEKIAHDALAELETYNPKEVLVTVEISPASTLKLIGHLQLASRHPGLNAGQQEFLHTMVDELSKGFRPSHTAIAELIRRGWDQQFDKDFAV